MLSPRKHQYGPRRHGQEESEKLLLARLDPTEFPATTKHQPLKFRTNMLHWFRKNGVQISRPMKFELEPICVVIYNLKSASCVDSYLIYDSWVFDYLRNRERCRLLPAADAEWYSIPRASILAYTKAPLF